jgi:transcription antitermination factor NusA-like protein
MRRALTSSLELQGAKRVAATQINAVIKQRLLDALGAAVGMTGSAFSGVIQELVVWAVSPGEVAP